MGGQIHKDSDPKETIVRIRKFLAEIGLFPQETAWHSIANDCFSVNLCDLDLPFCVVNGKGISKLYALASGYGEFIERIQARVLVRQKFGLMPNESFSYPDEIKISFNKLYARHKQIFNNLIKLPEQKILQNFHDKDFICFPYYNVADNTVVYLPLIQQVCGTNGMCAGNTPHEALCQGICEIFERFVAREVFNKVFDLPTIPHDTVKELEIYKLVKQIQNMGKHVLIKDCTLGGKFPVLCVILLNKERNKYLMRFGSDPIFEVALQRCMTELFQGIDANTLDKKVWVKIDFSQEQYKNRNFQSVQKEKDLEFQQYFITGTGELPNYVFFSGGEPHFNSAFQAKFENHKDSLKFLLNIIEKNRYKLYVRDVSFLGFPTFMTYIQGMSEITEINEDNSYITSESGFIEKCLLKLKTCPEDDLCKCAELLEKVFRIPYIYAHINHFQPILNLFNYVILEKSADFYQFNDIRFLLALMFYRVKKYDKAFEYLNIHLKEGIQRFDNLDYYMCALVFFKLKSGEITEEEIRKNLTSIFGEKLTQEVVEDCHNPHNIFQHFALPECGDCSLCPASEKCYYTKWETVNNKIIKKMSDNPIKQEDLSDIFK